MRLENGVHYLFHFSSSLNGVYFFIFPLLVQRVFLEKNEFLTKKNVRNCLKKMLEEGALDKKKKMEIRGTS